jgi:hypothetical protein
MKIKSLQKMVNGWFIGGFKPTAYSTKNVEVAIKKYKKGDFECSHHHKVATEVTVVISGSILMNGHTYTDDDIVVIEPGESTDFKALSDTISVVVKVPGASNDKYID